MDPDLLGNLLDQHATASNCSHGTGVTYRKTWSRMRF